MTQSNSENSTKSTVGKTGSKPTKSRPGDRHKGALLRLWCDPKLQSAWAGKTREHRALLAFAAQARLTPVEMRALLTELSTAKLFLVNGTDEYSRRAAAAIIKYLA